MANIIDYIKEYGDLDFSQKEFNSVDGLILSQFSYLKLDEIVPGVGENRDNMELRDILYHPLYEQLYGDVRYEKNNRNLYETMAKSRRFGFIELNHYINLINVKWEMQFSAICCFLPGGGCCVTYRGTDENLISWKEDFNMAFLPTIPAQIKAMDYLNYVAERITGDFMLAGHSKGGNLSIYAAMKCPKETYERISRIYSFDGPGFLKTATSEKELAAIDDRLIKLVPHSSIVGMLLQEHESYTVVESKNFGILQHDPFNWVVEGDDFIYRNDINDLIMIHNEAINEWAKGSDTETLRAFGNQVYDIMIECGVNDLNDFKGNYGEIIRKFTHVVENMEIEQKDVFKKVIKALFDCVIETIKGQQGKLKIDDKDKTSRRNI